MSRFLQDRVLDAGEERAKVGSGESVSHPSKFNELGVFDAHLFLFLASGGLGLDGVPRLESAQFGRPFVTRPTGQVPHHEMVRVVEVRKKALEAGVVDLDLDDGEWRAEVGGQRGEGVL